jgi:transcriptional regulator with XRE-family HTH domain
MMAKKFRALVEETLNQEQQSTARAEARAMRLEMNLRQIREKLSELSQEDVAELLNVTQPYISKLERQHDMLVSKLYDYVGTLGGQIEIHAKFPDRDVVLTQFDDLVLIIEAKMHQGSTRTPRTRPRVPQLAASAREAKGIAKTSLLSSRQKAPHARSVTSAKAAKAAKAARR